MAEDVTRGKEVGLCARCRHARTVKAPRATYWLCALFRDDPRFEKYPRLPVLACPGFEPRKDETDV